MCTFGGINNTAPCFDINSNSQKVRQCAEDETIFRIIMTLVIVLSNLASLLATLRLHRLINYVALYKASRALMCGGIQPIVHRAAVFQLIATNEDPELFDEIFKDGIDRSSIIDRPNSSGLTFLHAAVERKSLEKVKRLINVKPKGANVNLANTSKETPLHIAVENEYTEIVTHLIFATPYAADVNMPNSSRQTPLHIACEKESSEIVAVLLNAKADPNSTDNLGQTPLHIACGNESSEIVTQLLNANADTNLANPSARSSGQTPLHIACGKGSTVVVVQLLNAKTDVEKANNSGQTPLQIVCERGFTDITVELLNAGAKIWPRVEDKKGPDMTWLSLDSWRYGIKHIVEEPKMLELLQAWSSADEDSQEEAEMKVRDKFKGDLKVLTITLPAAMESQEKKNVQEVVRRWNNKYATKCE